MNRIKAILSRTFHGKTKMRQAIWKLKQKIEITEKRENFYSVIWSLFLVIYVLKASCQAPLASLFPRLCIDSLALFTLFLFIEFVISRCFLKQKRSEVAGIFLIPLIISMIIMCFVFS